MLKSKCFTLALVFLLASCATKPLKKETGLMAGDFWKDQEFRQKYFVKVDGKAKIKLEEKGRSISGNGRIFMHSRESIKIEIRDFLGRLHFSALKKGNSFMAHFPPQKLAFLDEEKGHVYLAQKLGVSLSFDEIVDLWMGRLPESIPGSSFKSWVWDAREESYVGKIEVKNMELECYVDGDLGVLKKLVWKKPGPMFQVTYEDYGACCKGNKSVDKLQMAYSAKLEVLRGSEKVEVEWEDLGVEMKLPRSFETELPKETEKVLLKP